MRQSQTNAEAWLWGILRDRRLAGAKFRRQHAVDLGSKRYILDFYCHEARLAVELDGGQHSETQDYDRDRDRAIAGAGIRVLRFWNNEVMGESEGVLQVLWDAVAKDHGSTDTDGQVQAPSPPAPLPEGEGRKPAFYVAARGHHADIGGITPGSMPPNSTHVDEEGVLFDNVQLVAEGRFLEDEIRLLLTTARYPARSPDTNLADLRAQVAACAKGALELNKMVVHFGLEVVIAYMTHVQDNAEESVRRVIHKLHDGAFTVNMDDGSVIRVKVSVDVEKREAVVDFTGTSDQRPTNYNAPSSVARAVVLYVFRTLVDDEIPMNAGCLKPIRIVIPKGSMLAPTYPAAVVAGNVETSQAATNCLYGALGVMAGAYGTMTNFTFGNDVYQYYETISGGAGAGPDFDGASVVQCHMTNSRLTDPEVLEWRFPVRLEEYKILPGTGGNGRFHGGDGGERRVRFLEPMTAAILANNRTNRPHGMAGGEPGKSGRNWVERTDGTRVEFGHVCNVAMNAGDVFVIQTPGGGGYGIA